MVSAFGPPRLLRSTRRASSSGNDRRERYVRLEGLDGWSRRSLASSTFLVAGVGALGNEVAKNLALLGAGRLLLVDPDRVEPSNLARSALFRPGDVGRPKAEAAARALRALNADVEAEPVVGDLRWDLGLGVLRRCALAFGCLDNREARLALNRMCRSVGVPWVNGGLDGWDGLVELYPDRGACYECSFTEADYAAVAGRYSCPARPAAGDGVPTAPTAASITGGLMVQLGLFAFPRRAEAYYYRRGDMVRSALQRRPGCPAHERLGSARPVAATQESPVADVLEAVPGTLLLDRDVVTALECGCGSRRSLLLPRHRLNGALMCRCGREMAPVTLRQIPTGHPLARRSLADLGVPPGHILEIVRRGGSTWVELSDWKGRAGGGGRGRSPLPKAPRPGAATNRYTLLHPRSTRYFKSMKTPSRERQGPPRALAPGARARVNAAARSQVDG